MLRRILRELVENGVYGEFAQDVAVPGIMEDTVVAGVPRPWSRSTLARAAVSTKQSRQEKIHKI